MSYEVKAGESVAQNLERVIRREIEDACNQLQRPREERDEAIHEARKCLKKIRGALRLIGPVLGSRLDRENELFRDIGRKLSTLRDATAMVEIFDQLHEAYHDEWDQSAAHTFRLALISRKDEVHEEQDADAVLLSVREKLAEAGRRLDDWHLAKDGFAAIRAGLKRTRQAGRREYRRVCRDPEPERFHDWRKRVKDHWYHMRLLEPVWPEMMGTYIARLKELETYLGDDHNLAVLKQLIDAEPERFGKDSAIRFLAFVIHRRQVYLRQQALWLGSRIYAERSTAFVDRIGRLWHVWRRGEGHSRHSDEPVEQIAT